MARDRRQITKQEPPTHLLRFAAEDWPDEQPNPAHPGRSVRVRPHIAWSKARREWVRRHVATEDEFDRLYFAADVVHPAGVNPQVDRDVDAVLVGHREWVTDLRAGRGPAT